jgi:hypothetical protein
VFPNPGNGECTISVDKVLVNGFIEVYDCLGQVVLSANLVQKTSIDLSHKANGIYFFVVKEKGQVIRIEKLVKE